jgi:hypothetical protein
MRRIKLINLNLLYDSLIIKIIVSMIFFHDTLLLSNISYNSKNNS